MTINIISPLEWKKQKWKNGTGITNELYVKSDSLGLVWRLSIANVTSDGPFSNFLGIDRVILLLEGNGFILKINNNIEKKIMEKFEPFCFNGEENINCELINGAIRDFNFMTRRSDVKALFRVIHLDEEVEIQLDRSPKVVLFVAKGQVSAIIKKEEYHLDEGYTLIFSNELDNMHLIGTCATIFVINLTGTNL